MEPFDCVFFCEFLCVYNLDEIAIKRAGLLLGGGFFFAKGQSGTTSFTAMCTSEKVLHLWWVGLLFIRTNNFVVVSHRSLFSMTVMSLQTF